MAQMTRLEEQSKTREQNAVYLTGMLKQAGTIVPDDGDGGVKAAGFLAERKFI